MLPLLSGCPFCESETQWILAANAHWYWSACLAPYWKFHTMIVPRRHIESPHEIDRDEEFKDYLEINEIAASGYRSSGFRRTASYTRHREDPFEIETNTPRLTHLHIHVFPDRAGLLDPVLDADARDWDPNELLISRH